jgi:hypothetical protein
MHVGEVSRALKIGEEYGKRLSEVAGNLSPDALDLLVNGYPSHGFVIDRSEAKTLFQNVRETTSNEADLLSVENLRSVVRTPKADGPVFGFISESRKEAASDIGDQQDIDKGSNATREGNSTTSSVDGGEKSPRSGESESNEQQTGTDG